MHKVQIENLPLPDILTDARGFGIELPIFEIVGSFLYSNFSEPK